MFHFPSGRPVTHKPSNYYAHNRKTRQRLAIQKAQLRAHLETRSILDLTIEELEQLLRHPQ